MITKKEFLRAAKDGDLKLVKQYVQNGRDVNIINKYGWTALMYASQYGHLEVVEYLVCAGADTSIQNDWGNTAIVYALINEYFEIAKIIENPDKYILCKRLDIDNESDAVKNSSIF